jgi:hypothetical protein
MCKLMGSICQREVLTHMYGASLGTSQPETNSSRFTWMGGEE